MLGNDHSWVDCQVLVQGSNSPGGWYTKLVGWPWQCRHRHNSAGNECGVLATHHSSCDRSEEKKSQEKCSHLLPEPKRRPSAKENRFWLWFGLFKKSKKSMVLHTDFPEGLAEIATGHQELQGILVWALKREDTIFIFFHWPQTFCQREKKENLSLSNKISTMSFTTARPLTQWQ
jgi:hypothetical protein